MKSIISHLGSQDFPRLRIGIGKSNGKQETVAHVLGKFVPEEAKIMEEVLYVAVKAVELSWNEGVEKSMSRYNGFSINSNRD